MQLNEKTKHTNRSIDKSSLRYLLAAAYSCLLISACSDELNTRGTRQRNAAQQNSSSNSMNSQNLLTGESGDFLALKWPQPSTKGYIAEQCPPAGENTPCSDDSTAVISAVDIMSRALHTHASVSIEVALATVIKLAGLHPNSKILTILSQIGKCSQKIASPEYEAALKTYKDHLNSVRYISAGRRKFLTEKGIVVPTLPSDNGIDSQQLTKLSLKEALNQFGDRSVPMEAGQIDMDGKAILSAGALRCSRALIPFMVQNFVNEAAAYPVSLSIIAPANSQSIVPGVAAVFEAKLTNTYDTNSLTWSIDEQIGSFAASYGTSKGSLTVNSWITTPTSATVKLQYFTYEGALNAESAIQITPKTVVSLSCSGEMMGYPGTISDSSKCADMTTISARQIYASVTGVSTTNEKQVEWSLQSGPGRISSAGLYTAPLEVADLGETVVIQAKRTAGTEIGTTSFKVVNRSRFIQLSAYQTSVPLSGGKITAFINFGDGNNSSSYSYDSLLQSLNFKFTPSSPTVAISRSGTQLVLDIPPTTSATKFALQASLPSGRELTTTPLIISTTSASTMEAP